MVPAGSARIPRVPAYSGAASACFGISRTGLSPAAARLSSAVPLSLFMAFSGGPTTPARRRHRSGLGSCAFARRYLRNHFCFLFLRVLRCFSSPGSPRAKGAVPGSLPAGCPIRRSAHQRVFAPTRGLSQLVTSFVASESQGILHAPLSSFPFSFRTGYVCRVPMTARLAASPKKRGRRRARS